MRALRAHSEKMQLYALQRMPHEFPLHRESEDAEQIALTI